MHILIQFQYYILNYQPLRFCHLLPSSCKDLAQWHTIDYIVGHAHTRMLHSLLKYIVGNAYLHVFDMTALLLYLKVRDTDKREIPYCFIRKRVVEATIIGSN